jgi:hypothetical protein
MDTPVARSRGIAPAGTRAGRHHATSCDAEFDEEEVAFLRAMDDYKRRSGHPFPTWTEALGVLRAMGYRRGPSRGGRRAPRPPAG